MLVLVVGVSVNLDLERISTLFVDISEFLYEFCAFWWGCLRGPQLFGAKRVGLNDINASRVWGFTFDTTHHHILIHGHIRDCTHVNGSGDPYK
jgi:hypothetical protein